MRMNIEIVINADGFIKAAFGRSEGDMPLDTLDVPAELRWHLDELVLSNQTVANGILSIIGEAYQKGNEFRAPARTPHTTTVRRRHHEVTAQLAHHTGDT